MKKYLFLFCCALFSCQSKKTESTNEATTSTAITGDSVRPETISPDGTITSLDSVDEAASTPAPNSATKENTGISWQISKSKIGPIQVGMAIDAMRQTIPAKLIKAIPITREGRGNQAYEIRQSNTEKQAGLLIEETCEPTCQVWRVHVQNAAYKTKEGLGVGSTLGEVKKHYKLSYLGAGETEIVAVSDEAKLSFMLDVSKVPEKQVPWLNLKNTPDSTPVKGMLIL